MTALFNILTPREKNTSLRSLETLLHFLELPSGKMIPLPLL
jgi:hypothetical protein